VPPVTREVYRHNGDATRCGIKQSRLLSDAAMDMLTVDRPIAASRVRVCATIFINQDTSAGENVGEPADALVLEDVSALSVKP
jgi:hypothetical protein